MGNPEKLTTWGTQDEDKQNTKCNSNLKVVSDISREHLNTLIKG
jgi:hypothetical protein